MMLYGAGRDEASHSPAPNLSLFLFGGSEILSGKPMAGYSGALPHKGSARRASLALRRSRRVSF